LIFLAALRDRSTREDTVMRGARVTIALLIGVVMLSARGAGGQEPQGATGTAQPITRGCEKIVAVLDQGGGSLSADEIAKKTNTDVETVRSCTDQWRRSMKGTNP
jgi:hypothetical protein